MIVIEALAAVRSSRFDLPLTYDPAGLELRVGDVVHVPLQSRDTLAYVVAGPHEVADSSRIKRVSERVDVPRAFDETGLALAQFVAERYVCTLGEALSAVTLNAALPRIVDVLDRSPQEPAPGRYPSVPARLTALIWNDLPQGFTLESLLRHPEARRAGDRASLLRYVQALIRGGELKRIRRFSTPKTLPYTMKLLYPGDIPIAGKKAAALVRFVREQPGVPRADALLAGFSHAVLARALKIGALREETIEPSRVRGTPLDGAPQVVPTADQRAALERIDGWIDRREPHEALLYGITGSGKTFVYLRAIERVVRAGGRALVLVPEISLTPQTAGRFEAVFGERVAVLHSALSERERFEAWQAAMRGEIDVVVGARSAVFAPLPDVRLIVVDEAHESTYKQDVVPRYHAVTVARERMRLAGGVVILGSATPSLESWSAAGDGGIELLQLKERATAQPLPPVHVVNMGREFEGGGRLFSARLTQALADRLAAGEKAVLFVNRRGSAGFMLCRSCGFVPKCTRCSVSLAVHRSERLLRCHYCDLQQPIPGVCPQCRKPTIAEFGIGTERVAEETAKLFPRARVVRMDSDTTTRVGDHARLLAEFETGGDVLVGTQMVAKGLDYPSVTLVGVVAADIGLHVADFRAAERTFDVITQVCGRSGRAGPGEAIVQTYAPEHPAIACAAAHDYRGFARQELAERRELDYPPFRRLAYLGVIGRDLPSVVRKSEEYASRLRDLRFAQVLGPAPYPVARVNREWRYRILIKTTNARALRDAIRERILVTARADRTTRVAVNIDP